MADLDGSDASPAESQASYSQGTAEEGAGSSVSRRISSVSGQTYTVTLSTAGNTSSSPSSSTAYRPGGASADSWLCNKIDERQRLARERREEREKQNVLREAEWQEREERAKHQYEIYLEERRRRLEEQKSREEKRRIAVEEKRKKKLEEDQARHEAGIRRTSERNQRTKPKPNRWSWGGSLPTHTPSTHAGLVESAFLDQLDLAGLEHLQGAFNLSRRSGMASQYSDRRAVSTMNLSKHMDPVITKRLSSSSATLTHSPDRALRMRTASSPVISSSQSKSHLYLGKTAHCRNTGLRHMPLSPWENMMVNRLQQPTHSYLARSRSTASLSKELSAMPVCPRSVSCHPTGPMSFKSIQAQPLPHCRSHDRYLSHGAGPCQPVCRRNPGSLQKEHESTRKSWSNLTLPLAPTLSLPPRKRNSSPGKRTSKVTSPSPGRPPQKPAMRPPTPKLKSPVADDPGNLRPLKVTPEITLAPPSASARRGKEGQGAEEVEEGSVALSPPHPRPQPLGQNRRSLEQAPSAPAPPPATPPAPSTPEGVASSPPTHKASAGTTDREEAGRILAENRRLAREQREREEEERRQLEEQQRLAKEEMTRRKAEERARREEEAQQQAEQRRLREEEERIVEEERLQKEKEEAEKLQRQREEEEARQKEQVERLRQERDKHFQKEEAERLERKKRLEEIMKRTRRSDPSDKKATPQRNGGDTAVSPGPPGQPSPAPPGAQHQNGNGHVGPDSTPAPLSDTSVTPLTPPDGRENGEFEEVIMLPSDTRQRPPGEEQQPDPREERDRFIAFRENGLHKPLGGLEDLAPHQETDVA